MNVGEAGTYRYMSPEQMKGKVTLSTDVWAFGCIILEFCTGLMPYHKVTNDFGIVMLIKKGHTPLDYILDRENYCE